MEIKNKEINMFIQNFYTNMAQSPASNNHGDTLDPTGHY